MIKTFTPMSVYQALDNHEIVLIDLRNPIEFAQVRIVGALNAPLATLVPQSFFAEQNHRIVFHCGSGKWSERAAAICMDAWGVDVTHMEGGLSAWLSAGLPHLALDPMSGEITNVGSDK